MEHPAKIGLRFWGPGEIVEFEGEGPWELVFDPAADLDIPHVQAFELGRELGVYITTGIFAGHWVRINWKKTKALY